jgi:hypothetical protein
VSASAAIGISDLSVYRSIEKKDHACHNPTGNRNGINRIRAFPLEGSILQQTAIPWGSIALVQLKTL